MNSRVGGKESVNPGLRAFRRSTLEEVNKIPGTGHAGPNSKKGKKYCFLANHFSTCYISQRRGNR